MVAQRFISTNQLEFNFEKLMSVKAWNDEEEAKLIKMYTEDGVKDVYQLAEYFQKGYRSVISKLVQLKIYEKPEVMKHKKGQKLKLK